MEINWEQIGGWIAGLGFAATTAWGLVQKFKKDKATTRADIADANADRSVADSQTTVYNMLTSRLETLETEVRGLRAELSVERVHSRKLELHIWKLENLMRAQGMEPPAFVGAELGT